MTDGGHSPEPVQFSEVTPVIVGTAGWAVLLVIGLIFRHDLNDDGHGWWIWTAAAGVVLGLIGYRLMLRRQSRPAGSAPGPEPENT